MLTNGDIGGGAYVQMVTSRQYFFSINIFFKDHDIDYLIAACNAAGSSAFHFIERRMAPLSKELPGIVMPHDSFGTHLDENGKTTDDVKEQQNFPQERSTYSKTLFFTTARIVAPYSNASPKTRVKYCNEKHICEQFTGRYHQSRYM